MWSAIVKETETLAGIVKSNADTVCSQTIEKLVNLIEEKKVSKVAYAEERRRLDDDLKKVTK